MRFWVWLWGILTVGMSISALGITLASGGYQKNSYFMFIAILVSFLMWRWAFYQHKRWLLRKKYRLERKKQQKIDSEVLPDNAS